MAFNLFDLKVKPIFITGKEKKDEKNKLGMDNGLGNAVAGAFPYPK